FSGVDGDVELLTGLIGPRTPVEVQLASIERLAQLGAAAAPRAWLDQWPTATPAVRLAIIDALLGRGAWSRELLTAIDARFLRPSEIDAARRQLLVRSSDTAVRAAAARTFAEETSGDRREILARYAGAVTTPGDRGRGREVFARNCASCHRLDNVGHAIGPDLAPLAHKLPEALLAAILDPNQAVDPRYLNYLAITEDGRQFSGMLTGETATSMTLVAQDNKQQVLLRTAVTELASSGRSLMPEGLEQQIDVPAMADLLAYLAAVAQPPKSFAGNQPALVTADATGKYVLAAAQCEIRGPQLIFEPEFGNLGYWSAPDDSALWTVQIDSAGAYDVMLDYACHNDSAGTSYCLETPAGPLRGEGEGPGGWSDYRTQRIGSVQLPAGTRKWGLRADGPINGAMLDLRAIQLVPKAP
ncbi:MAG: c-type cytochrome, partial [Planctomycetaceae bacterium]|nr:c-type cytochrome [Planctomycetaceae bacterium]